MAEENSAPAPAHWRQRPHGLHRAFGRFPKQQGFSINIGMNRRQESRTNLQFSRRERRRRPHALRRNLLGLSLWHAHDRFGIPWMINVEKAEPKSALPQSRPASWPIHSTAAERTATQPRANVVILRAPAAKRSSAHRTVVILRASDGDARRISTLNPSTT